MIARDAERALLGTILAGYPHVDALAEIVRPTDFMDPRDEEIFGAMVTVAQAGGRADGVATLLAMRPQLGQQAALGDYLHDLLAAAPVAASADYYAAVVRDAATKRRVATAATRIGQIAEQEMDADAMLDLAQSTLAEVTEARAKADVVWAADVLAEIVDIAEQGRSRGLSTPWPGVDRVIGGIQAGRLYVVAARPGVGKSLMGANLALHVGHRHQRGALLCSMEMDRVEVMQRMVSAHAKVSLTGLMAGGSQMSQAGWDSLSAKSQEVMDLPVAVEDGAGQSLTSIRAALRRVKRQRPDTALVVVDYLQLMRTSAKTTNRAEALGEISRGLKVIAREFEVAVVAMAQLNREAANGRPTIAQIRESGAIEADADVVILLHRADDEIPELDVLIEKNRSGPRGTSTLTIEGHYSRLTDDFRDERQQWRPA